MPSDVQDALVTILSEKALPVPELDTRSQAVAGFNLIATANDRDRGVNELSSALRRRFNTVVLPLPDDRRGGDGDRRPARRRARRRARAAAGARRRRRDPPRRHDLPRAARRRHRDGRTSLKVPTGTLSTAEAISVVTNGLALAAHFGDGTLRPTTSPPASSARRRDPVHDGIAWREYLETVVADRDGWGDFYEACREPSWADAPAAMHLLGIRHHGPGLGAVGRWRASTSCDPTSCWSRRRPRPSRRSRGSATPTSSRRSRCSATSVDEPRAAVFAPFASFSPEWQALRWANAHGVGRRSTCRWRTCSPPDRADAGGSPHDGEPERSDRARWPRPPANRRRALVGRRDRAPRRRPRRRSRRSPRRWRRCAPASVDLGVERARGAHARAIRRGVRRRPDRSPSSAGRGTCPRSTSPAHGGDRRRDAARPAEGQGRGDAGCRGRTAGSPRRPATAPACAARAGTTTCSAIPGPRVSPASSSTPPACCATSRLPTRRPTTSSRRPAAGRRAGRAARTAAPGLAEVLDAAESVMGGLPLVERRLVVGDAIGAVPDDARRRCRSPAISPAAAGGPAQAAAEPRRSSSTCARRTGCAARTCCTAVALGVPWGALEEGAARAARSARPGGWRGSPSCRCGSSSSPATAPPSSRRPPPARRAAAGADGCRRRRAALELALLADLPDADRPISRARTPAPPTIPTSQLMAALGPSPRRSATATCGDRPRAAAAVFDGLVVPGAAGWSRRARRSTTTPPR